MSSSSSSSGSMRSEKSPDVLNPKKKKKRVKQLTMQTVQVNKTEREDEQAEETRKKRRDARSYRALFTKPKKVDGTDRRDDPNGVDTGTREEKVLEEFSERTHERTTVKSTCQFAEEALKRNNEHKLFPTTQKNSRKDMSSNGGDQQISQNGLVAEEMNDDAETAMLKNLQSPKLVNSIAPGGVLDCDISVEMVPQVMPSKRKSHDIDIDSAASPKMSSGCKEKDCTETDGMCSRRQRVDCNSTKNDICSSNMKLNQFCGSSDVKSASGSEVRPSKIIHIVDDEATTYNDPINKARPFNEINSERASLECNLTAKSCGVDEQAVSRDSCLREQDSVDEIPNGGVQVDDPVTINSGDVTENALSMRCSDKYQISDGSKANTSARETVSLTDPLENLLSMEAPSSEKNSDINTLRKVDCEIPLRESRTIISCEGRENFVSLEASSSVEIPDESNLSKVDDGPVPLREPVVANSGEGQENLVSEEAFSSEEIPNEAALNNFDGEVHLGSPKTVSSGEGYESLQSLLVPSSEVPGGTTSNTAERELPLSRPEDICSTEDQENSVSANRSIEKQIPGEATLNVPDEEIPKSISEIATSCDGMDITVCTKSSTSKEQIPDTMACSMPAKEVSLAEPETAPSEVLEGRRVQTENDGTSPNESDQQDGVLCTMSRESALREPSSDLVSANVDSLPYASSEVHSGFFANNEMQNASRAAETSPFNGAIDVTCDVSNPDATVVELTEKMQQLRSSESTSNLFPPDLPSVSAVEHQSNNEGQTANQSSQVPRQPVANHIELSNQDVLQPLDSSIDGLVSQASETRTFPVPSVSNGLPLWTVAAATSWMPMTSNYDPLQNEMERIKEKMEQTTKIHEDTKLRLKLECDKEIEEVVAQIRRQYDVKVKEKLAEFLLHEKELDVNYSKVHLNKILAEAFRSKCMDNRASGSAGAQQEASSSFLQQLFQLSSQQMVQQPSAASGFPSTDSASSMQTVSPAVVNAQTMRPPLQVVNPSTLISGTPTRPPHISTISTSTVNPQIGTEIRAPAPHLQPFRPSSSFSPSSLPLHSGGMSSQQAQHNHPAASLLLHQSYVNSLAHRQASTTGPSGRNQHEIARGCTAPPNSRSPSLNVLTGVIDLSGASANPPGFLLPDCSSRLGTRLHRESHVPSSRSHSSQPSGGATDIVCLSDDD